MEYIANGIGEAEKILSYQDKVESGPLSADRMSQTIGAKDFAKKLSKMEEENTELKADRAADKLRNSNLEAKLEKMMLAMERQLKLI